MSNKKQDQKKSRYTLKLAKFICAEIEKGNTISEICERLYPDITPKTSTVYSWQARKPEFKKMVTASYELFILRKIDELDYYSKTPLDELYPDTVSERVQMDNRRTRIKTLEYFTSKIAAHLNDRFDKAQKVEVENKGAPTIQLVNWGDSTTLGTAPTGDVSGAAVVDNATTDRKEDKREH